METLNATPARAGYGPCIAVMLLAMALQTPRQDAEPGRQRVLVLGGGFGGLFTALNLARHGGNLTVQLVEPRQRFLFSPFLYELLSGELRLWEVAPRFDQLLAGCGIVQFRQRAVSVDPRRRSVLTDAGSRLGYDRLVIATGGQQETFGIPGAAEHAIPFRSLEDLRRTARLLEQLRQQRGAQGRIAVVGAGYSGVELACKLADLLKGAAEVTLIEQAQQALENCKAFNREQALAALRKRAVALRCSTRVLALESGSLLLERQGQRQDLPVDGTLWTAGLGVRPPSIEAELPDQPRGRLRCTETLMVKGLEGVYALGDVALVTGADGGSLPATAQVALQQAECLADNLIASFSGAPQRPFRWHDLGEMLSLGIADATLTAMGVTMAGPAAARLRQAIYLARLPGSRHRIDVALGWLGGIALSGLPS